MLILNFFDRNLGFLVIDLKRLSFGTTDHFPQGYKSRPVRAHNFYLIFRDFPFLSGKSVIRTVVYFFGGPDCWKHFLFRRERTGDSKNISVSKLILSHLADLLFCQSGIFLQLFSQVLVNFDQIFIEFVILSSSDVFLGLAVEFVGSIILSLILVFKLDNLRLVPFLTLLRLESIFSSRQHFLHIYFVTRVIFIVFSVNTFLFILDWVDVFSILVFTFLQILYELRFQLRFFYFALLTLLIFWQVAVFLLKLFFMFIYLL